MESSNRSIPKRDYLGTPATAPGPSGPQMLRRFLAVRSNPLGYLDSVWREFGDVVQFPVPKPPSYFVNDLSAVRQVLVSDYKNFTKQTIQYRSLSAVTGEGLLTADGDSWRRQRPLVQPAFHHESLNRVGDQVAEVTANLVLALRSRDHSQPIDCDSEMMKAALEVVGKSLFGQDLKADSGRLTKATLAALDVVVARARPAIQFPSWIPTPNNRKLKWAVEQLDSAVNSILAERSEVMPESPDLVDLLRFAQDSSGSGLTTKELRDQIVTFIVAGHETVASALTWALALLSQYPEVQDRLAQEAEQVLSGDTATAADYPQLTYTKAVFDEVLRLYPPAWLITRKSIAATQLGGREVPADSLVILSPWLLHRHPDYWANPEEFRPERFLEADFNRNAFIPFGAGMRQCIGKDFAYLEGVMMLASLVRDFEFTFPDGAKLPVVDPLVTVRPKNGLPLLVRPRNRQ